MSPPLSQSCPICGEKARRVAAIPRTCVIRRCTGCGAHFALYEPKTPQQQGEDCDHFRGLDCSKYERSVRAVREASYGPLLERVGRFARAGAWLDVGCSYGWLLARVRHAGFSPYGVEPSPGAAASAREAGLDVETGTFPAVIGNGQPYAVVSFMDVLEHLQEPRETLRRARGLLAAGGLVLIQVPDQSCLLYRLAAAMCGWTGGRLCFALRRMWLADLDFPHLIYFGRKSLSRLLADAGYETVDCWRSAIGTPESAGDRVGYLSQPGQPPAALVSWAVASIQRIDSWSGHGGILTVIARPRVEPGPPDPPGSARPGEECRT